MSDKIRFKALNPSNFSPEKLNILENYLKSRVIGQERAIKEIIGMMNIAEAGINNPKKPLGVLFFAGPTGVGKTEMALSLANYFYEQFLNSPVQKSLGLTMVWDKKPTDDFLTLLPSTPKNKTDKKCLVRVDCGKYGGTMGHAVMNLLGSPVSYVGREQTPTFTPEVFLFNRRTVLLFDEIEKAFTGNNDGAQNFIGILMRILDEGIIQNNHDETVNFLQTFIIFTSNLGSREIIESVNEKRIGFRQSKIKKGEALSDEEIEKINDNIYKAVKEKYEEEFPPELRARIHRLIVFRFLTKKDFAVILEKNLAKFSSVILKNKKIKLFFSKKIKSWILDNAHLEYGVRNIDNVIKREIEYNLAKILNTSGNPIEKKIQATGEPVFIYTDIGNDEVVFLIKSDNTPS